MISLDDLAQLAEDLRKRGLDAAHEFLYGPRGWIEGLEIGDDFFPLWELGLPENSDALERADFATIKQRRRSDWSMEAPPKLSSAMS
ncbi:MAG TPA: hypothetical protein VKX45_24935 [Bryobacteraceae bacterium]|jgi:hypothetical protein|nr:hypothetical protein [Bryobacteraceae bacterium]